MDTLITHGLMLSIGEECSFAHALVHDAIYASLPKARREALHRRAAEWYRDRDPGLCAQHLDRASDPDAAVAFLHAAAAARSSFRLEEALSLVEQGEKAAGADAVRIALALERGSLLHDLGRTEDATAAYQSALGLAEAPKDRCLALIGLAGSMRISDRIEEAFQALSEAEGIASILGLDAERARIHYLRGSLYFPRGWMHESRIEQEQALEFAKRAGSPELELLALSGLGDAYYGEGRMQSASQAFAHCIAVARKHGLKRIEVANLPMLALTKFLNGELKRGLDIGRTAVAEAKHVGNRRGEIIGHHVVFFTNLERDDLDAAQRALDQSHSIAMELKARRFQAEGLGFMAQVARCAGDRASALAKAREALAIARETGIEYVGGLILGELAAAAETESERQQAREEALALLARGSLPHNHFWFYQSSIEADLERGAWDDVLRWADALEAYTKDEPRPYTELLVRLARLSVRTVRSKDHDAAAELEGIAAEYSERGFARFAKLARKMATRVDDPEAASPA